MATMTKLEFNQNVGLAESHADSNPVFITDNGKISYVLLKYEDYIPQTEDKNLLDLLSCEEVADIDFEPERICIKPRPVEF